MRASIKIALIIMDAEATKPPDTVQTVVPDSDTSVAIQNETQENILTQSGMAHQLSAQENAAELESAMESNSFNADTNVQNSAPDEVARPAECETQKMELKIPQEHARLDALLSQIPKKAQHGLLMQCDLILTCIDANEHYIALGTNIGLTFLYNRKDQSMQRLKCEVFVLVSFFLSFHPFDCVFPYYIYIENIFYIL